MRDSGLGGIFSRIVVPVTDRVRRQQSPLEKVLRICMLMFGLISLAAVSVVCEHPEEPIEKLGPRTYCLSDGWVSTRFRMPKTSLAWRPDGSELVFSVGPDIHAVSTDGRQLRTLAVVFPPDAESRWTTTTAFSLAPGGSRMVYATCEFVPYPSTRPYPTNADLHELAVLNLDRPDLPPQRLTTNDVIDYDPAWSPDGQRIAYLRGLPNEAFAVNPYRLNRELTPGSLHVMAADGSGKRSVHTGAALIGPPRWSPDGRWLAFLNVDGDAGLGLYVVNADHTLRRRLSDAVSEVSWSPDSRQLAFIRLDGEQRALYTIAVAADGGAEARRIAGIPEESPGLHTLRKDETEALPLVAWSPAGGHIAYECGFERLCIVAPDGSRIGGPPLYGQAVGWSRDGSRLALVVGDLERHQWHYRETQLIPRLGGDRTIKVYTVAPDGGDLRPLVREREDYSLVAAAAA